LDYLKVGLRKRKRRLAVQQPADLGTSSSHRPEYLIVPGRLFLFLACFCTLASGVSHPRTHFLTGNRLAWAKYPRQADDCLIRHNCNQLAPIETQIGEKSKSSRKRLSGGVLA
jgi:hypothetical protein